MLRTLLVSFVFALMLIGCGDQRIVENQDVVKSPIELYLAEPRVHEVHGRKMIELYRGGSWALSRYFPSGYLDIFVIENNQISSDPIPLPLRFRKDSYPLWVGEGKSGNLYLVIYDVIKNSPSGRTLSDVHEGLSIYEISAKGNLSLIADDIALGGIDTQIYGIAGDFGIDICGENFCYSIGSDRKVEKWDTSFLSSDEFVEVRFTPGRAAAVIRKRYDDRLQSDFSTDYSKYSVINFDKHGLNQRKEIEAGAPYDLTWDKQTIFYRKAVSREDYLEMLLFDLSKMRFRGLLDFGTNNLEGRVAWSQAYYINGFLSLLNGYGPNLSEAAREYLRKRVVEELSLMAGLCDNDYPGFEVKRYSIDRENTLFALHLGRVLDLFSRADFMVASNQRIQECKAKIKTELTSLKNTVEKIHASSLNDNSKMTMRYRYGYPFWADGANVPFNYISGYVAGLLSFDRSVDDIRVAKQLSQPLISEEFENEFPILWRYWQGVGDAGWKASDHVSLNTPSYVGNKRAMAHITYRTMDAYALLKLHEADQNVVSNALIDHFRALIRDGRLLPSLNEVFMDAGQDPVLMASEVVSRYSRSVYAYELESQVLVLGQLTRRKNQQ
ncbi:hypothetical protein KVP09_14215 [Alcaligenaceae bacterium CGII-47]|nr:hypothetical protein [Alcaligenaceae bacterium CGII-47]